jgi:hypothetical protein
MHDLLCQMWLITNPKVCVFDVHVHKYKVRVCVFYMFLRLSKNVMKYNNQRGANIIYKSYTFEPSRPS